MRNLILVLVVVAALLAINSVYVVQESQVGVRFQFGRIVEDNIQPGLHFKLPFVQQVRLFDRRVLTLDAAPERYLTGEKKDVSIDFFAKWRIEDVRRYYTATGGNQEVALARLNPIIREVLRNQVNRRTLQEVVAAARTDMTERLVELANEAAETLGIEIVDVRIKRIDLPEDGNVIASVFERMRAERKRVANELRAEGEEAAETIRAEADRAVAVMLAEAERDAQQARGEGDARATEIYAGSYGKYPEFYAFYRSLEAYREAFGDGRGVMVLDPESEFFRYFRDAGVDRSAQ
jgi:membrane protease subunit HflC